jgi:hypothetical protein
MHGLIQYREGEEYARFIDEGLLDQLVALLDRSPDMISDLLIKVVGPFPLPACCAPPVAELNKQAREKDEICADAAFRRLERLGCSRGLK